MATNVDLNSGKCKVTVSVDCPCKLSIQGCELDAVPGDVFYFEQVEPSFPAAFFINVRNLPSPVGRIVSLRNNIAGRLDAVRKLSCSEGMSYERGYKSCRDFSLSEFLGMLDDIIKDYSL